MALAEEAPLEAPGAPPSEDGEPAAANADDGDAEPTATPRGSERVVVRTRANFARETAALPAARRRRQLPAARQPPPPSDSKPLITDKKH
jgi:hypothetical protein